jgi:hypothetical protein
MYTCARRLIQRVAARRSAVRVCVAIGSGIALRVGRRESIRVCVAIGSGIALRVGRGESVGLS